MCASPAASTLTFRFRDVFFVDFAILQCLFNRLFLIRHRLALSFARAAVVLGMLSAQGKSQSVTDAPVATDVHHSLDAHLYFRAQFSFYLEALLNDASDLTQLIIVPVFYFDVRVDLSLLEDLLGTASADPVDVGESDLSTLVAR